jgi:hypothetical protein
MGGWRDEYRGGLVDVAAALNRIADEQAIANRIAMHDKRISQYDAAMILDPPPWAPPPSPPEQPRG